MMYFSIPCLLCLQATKCMIQLHDEIKNLSSENKDREPRSSCNWHPNCALCLQQINLSRGMSRKAHYQWYIWRHTLQQQPDFDPTDNGWTGERMRYLYLYSQSLSLLQLLEGQITCSTHQTFLLFGEFIEGCVWLANLDLDFENLNPDFPIEREIWKRISPLRNPSSGWISIKKSKSGFFGFPFLLFDWEIWKRFC